VWLVPFDVLHIFYLVLPRLNKNMKAGLVIGSFGMPDFVALQLKVARIICGDVPTLIADDGSPQVNELRKVSRQFKVPVNPNIRRQGHHEGDLSAFRKAILWGHRMGLSHVWKVSQRFIPLVPNWVRPFEGIACGRKGSILRTECIGLCVNSLYPILNQFDKVEPGQYTENKLDEVLSKFGNYLHQWDELPAERTTRSEGFVSRWTHTAAEYRQLAQDFGMPLEPMLEGWNSA
jgi:hypothetical protein